MTKKELNRFLKSLVSIRKQATDDQALKSKYVYSQWKEDTEYAVDERVIYLDVLYKCLIAHTSQSIWVPINSPSLWAIVHYSIQPWIQPVGTTDAYMTGDKVTHNNKTWISIVDYNIWEPGIYGWEEL